MKHRRPPRRLSALLVVAGLFAFTGMAAPAAAQAFQDDEQIRALAEGLQNGTIPLSIASEQCRQGIAAGEDPEEIVQFMSTFLVVPEELALAALCSALVHAVLAGDVSADGLVLALQEEQDVGSLLEFGRLLRAVYFSHRLTTTAAAAGQVAQ